MNKTNQIIDNIIKDMENLHKHLKQFNEDWRFINSKDFKFEMVKNKYYWILVERETFHSKQIRNYVSKEHPFSYVKSLYNPLLQEERVTLLNWKEITKEEYELYNTIV